MIKKIIIGVIGLVIILIVFAVIGSSLPTKVEIGGSKLNLPVKTENEKSLLKNAADSTITYDLVKENPYKYKGKVVSWGGRVFVEPRKTSNGIELQIFLNDISDKNFYTFYNEPSFQVAREEFVVVHGVLAGTYRGSNLFGATLEIPKIEAGYIEKTSRSQAVAPTKKTVQVGKTIDPKGFTVTLDKIELAVNETRVYLTIKNSNKHKISFYTYSTKLVQNNKQFERKMLFGEKQEEIPSEFLSGVEAKGTLVFPQIEETGSIKLVFDKPYASDLSFEESMAGEGDFKEIIFEVNL